ncbi:MAG: DUF4962 domain-containing protein [Phycisphaerae bacterium]
MNRALLSGIWIALITCSHPVRAESVVPANDPAEANPPKLVESVMAAHPRLLFGPGDIPALRKLARTEGKVFFQQMVEYLPVCKAPQQPKFQTDATDGQRVGLWRMPTAALHHVITGERKSLDQAQSYLDLLLKLEHWETGKERDSGMSSANLLIGAALSYDWLHDQLEPAYREKVRKRLLEMARRQYYGGHLNGNNATAYWQGDPANNHRWHRDAGMVLAVLTAYEGDQADNWLLARCFEEMELITGHLPPDGSSHEGPSYLIFGGAHLTLAAQAADRCFGTKYLQQSFFRNAPLFRLHTVAPGLAEPLGFGDNAGMGSYSNFLYQCASVHALADVQAGLDAHRKANPEAWWLGWMSLVWFDPDLPDGSLNDLPTAALFPDIGLATFRDQWGPGGVAATFKCGPFGGYALNAYRNANGFKYINVAHDDPDANAFTIFAGGSMLAETDRYSRSKKSANHNTILVNGVGQTVAGRKEGMVWTQPAVGGDMTKMAVITAAATRGDVTLVQGEAAGSYPAIRNTRPGLDRFGRSFIWVRGRYILVLDEIAAPEPVEISWLLQGPELQAGEKPGRYVLSKGAARCPVQVICRSEGQAKIVTSPADHRGKALGFRQLRLVTSTAATRIVSLYDPWNTGASCKADFAAGVSGAASVTVSGDGFVDRWDWPAGRGRFEATRLTARRGTQMLFELPAQPIDADFSIGGAR